MILSSIIAKVLALTEGILDQFVTVGTSADNTVVYGACGLTVVSLNAALTPCGSQLVATLAGLTEAVLQLFGGILPGLMVVKG